MAIPLELSQFAKVLEYNGTASSGVKVGVGINTNHTSFAIGIGTTNPSATLDVNGTLNVSGVSTIGLANTSLPLNNSQMSFELTSDTNLRIKVRGFDGVLRSADITLS